MKIQILNNKDYFNYFHLQETESCCGIEVEKSTKEKYFFIQTFLPKSFFDLEINNVFLIQLLNSLPEKIKIKFELFGIGTLGGKEAFVFKPWIIGTENPILFELFENFHLFIPDLLFFDLINKEIFLDHIEINDFSEVRVLQNLNIDVFVRFGLNKEYKIEENKNENLSILKIENINTTEIIEFYKNNSDEITSELHHKYFREFYNDWYEIRNHDKQKIGYIRLYFLNNTYSGEISIEYIIKKEFRNYGYATDAIQLMIKYLNRHSCAISVGAEVEEKNIYSKRILQNLGFTEKSTNPYDRNNYTITLMGKLEDLNKRFESGNLEVNILDYFARKHSDYFN